MPQSNTWIDANIYTLWLQLGIFITCTSIMMLFVSIYFTLKQRHNLIRKMNNPFPSSNNLQFH
uniref:Uncharacterized protein n=1 Tax=viral metagenome TaxID=1070528 RepID=A0A6C0KJS2_9ZZZZ